MDEALFLGEVVSFPLCPASAMSHWFLNPALTFSLAQRSLVGKGFDSLAGGPADGWTGARRGLASSGTFDSM